MITSEFNEKSIAKGLMPGADPVFIKGNKTGFLFVHGFTGASYEGRELAQWLHDREGLTVSVPLLPGHGTTPEDLKGINWVDWYLHARTKLLELKESCNQIFVCGQSMGGAIALQIASHHPVSGVITLAGVAFLKDWRLKLLPFARHIIPYQHKSKGPDIRNKELKSQVASYHKYPVKSIDQFLALLEHTRGDLPEVTAPALLIHARKDRTVHFSNLKYIYDHISSREKEKIVLEKSYHVISIDIEKEIVFNHILSFINKISNK
jgi:carboxylesterase